MSGLSTDIKISENESIEGAINLDEESDQDIKSKENLQPIEATVQDIKSEENLQLVNNQVEINYANVLTESLKDIGLSDEDTIVLLKSHDISSERENENEDSFTLIDNSSQTGRDEDELRTNGSQVENIKDREYHVRPVNVDYELYAADSVQSPQAPHGENFEGLSPRYFTDNVLIIKKNFAKIFKAGSGLNTRKDLVFIVDNYVLEKINKNEYNLDDLQYNVAKAIGIKPEHITITNVISHLKESNKSFNNLRLTTMPDQTSSLNAQSEEPAKLKFIQVKTRELYPLNIFVENISHGIQWCGGFRNRKTGILYYNATSQTEPRAVSRDYYLPYLIAKQTQTPLTCKDKGINLPVDHSTQMWRIDYYMPADTDIIVSSAIYEEYSAESTKAKAAIIIQKYWRGMKVRKYELPRIRKERLSRDQGYGLFDEEPFDENYLRAKILEMIFPDKRKHFYQINNILHEFIQDLKRQLSDIYLDDAKKRFNFEITEKEIAETKTIHKRRLLASNDGLGKRDKNRLELSSCPTIKFKNDKNCINLVESIVMTQCKQFKELFNLFNRENISIDQRIEVLLIFRDLMESVEDFEMKDELIELINRECILLSSGIPAKYLNMLRKRCEAIIRNFIRSFETADRIQNYKPGALQQILRCTSCAKFKHMYDFTFDVRQNTIKRCKSCLYKFSSYKTPVNFSIFNTLLQYIRKDEFSKICVSPYLILLQPQGIEYIIMKIWGGHSIISYSSLLSRLRLPRWDITEPWAPWNCILLTEEEAKRHLTIKNIYDFYSPTLCKMIKLKHLRAKKEFDRIFEFENLMRNKCEPIGNAKWITVR